MDPLLRTKTRFIEARMTKRHGLPHRGGEGSGGGHSEGGDGGGNSEGSSPGSGGDGGYGSK